MARTYTLKRRAKQQAQTRQKIVDAAVALHGTIGPAATTVSMIAEKAGVQRHTFYAHFPDERAMLMACSGHSFALDPPPDAEAWRALADPAMRLRAGLAAIYDWYARNGGLLACVLRDAEQHALVREISELRFGPSLAQWNETLSEALDERQRALLTLALSFHTWRTLTHEAGMEQDQAVAAMAAAVCSPAR